MKYHGRIESNWRVFVLQENFKHLTTLYEYLSVKYHQLFEQSKETNETIAGLIKSLKVMQIEITSNMEMALKATGETAEMAQYIRRDCLEISGKKPNAQFSSESKIGKVYIYAILPQRCQ